MNPRAILEETRKKIAEYAGDDPDQWWYANRYVFARLNLDERRTKAGVKRKLLDAHSLCHGCGKSFESRRDIHLHRLDGGKAYSDANCVLMHAECHRRYHAGHQEETMHISSNEPVLTKWSKRYENKTFHYWWDIAPSAISNLDALETMEFAKKDTGERCNISIESLKGLLIPARQTTRGQGNWGIKILKDRPDELAFEPGVDDKQWRFMPVVWLSDTED